MYPKRFGRIMESLLNNETYQHFTTVEECDAYVERHRYTYRRCCGGKGICIPVTVKSVNVKPVKKTQDDCCCVCFEKTNDLTSCGHVLCSSCTEKVAPLCPYCRQTLVR